MRLLPGPRVLQLSFLLAASLIAQAVTVEELRHTPDLTPQKFASFFSEFEFKYHNEVQAPDVFLATRSGDCDDYATLAARILSEKGYKTRLITVRMPKVVHVVCYVEETKCYLDYNNRNCLIRTVGSGADINKIADKVARSYHAKWSSASEFTFEDGVKRLVKTVLPEKAEGGIFASIFR